MSNAKDPFEMDDGFEDIPAAKAPVQVVNKVANTVVKQTAQQVKATTKAFLSQLYGSSDPASTSDDQQADTTVDPMAQAQAQKVQAGQVHMPAPQQVTHANTTSSSNTSQSEQEKIQKARRELQQTHRSDYYIPTFGDISNLESDIQKEAQKRQQEEQQREQEEEQEKQQLQQLEEQKKQEVPMAVQQSRTKSERRPGAG